jgi:Spy/CpxP family protein refolding chaperone
MRFLCTILTALTLSTFAGVARAQPIDEPPPPDGEDEPSDEDRGRMMERVRMMRMYALTEALALDEATAAKLFPYLREGDEAMEALHEQKRGCMKELRAMTRAGTYDKKEVDRLVKALGDVDVALTKERSRQLEGLGRVLDPERQVKFLLVRNRFEGEVRDMIRQERHRERGDRRR